MTEAGPAAAAHGGGETHPAPASLYRRSDAVATRVIAGETLVVPFKGTLASLQQIFALNPVAAFVWQRLDGRATLGSILAEVVTSFEVTNQQAWADLRELIAGLHDAGLVHEVVGDAGDASNA